MTQKVAEAEERLKASESSEHDELKKQLDELKAEQTKTKEGLEEELKPIRKELERQEKRSPLEGAP